jgi:lon-related putative ATP-dependent protease
VSQSAERTVRERLALAPEELRRRLDPGSLDFESTADVEPVQGTIGQPRASEAVAFGLEIETFGYNLYVAGAPGSGREGTVRDYLERVAAARAAPDDWVYVHNFDDSDRPRALSLPAGRGSDLEADMRRLAEVAKRDIPQAFEGEEYARRREQALAQLVEHREKVMAELFEFAQQRGFGLQLAPGGLVRSPLIDGRPITPQDLESLSDEQRAELERRDEEVKSRSEEALRELRRVEKQAGERTTELDRAVVASAVGPLLDELRERYRDLHHVQSYLDAVGADLPEQLPLFRRDEQEQAAALPGLAGAQRGEELGRYDVNVLVDNSKLDGSPIVIERNPTYYNLVGRVEYRATFGATVTDFRQIKPGALHRANGGFLLVHLQDVLQQPFAFDALKRCLAAREVRIENLAEQSSAVPTATVRPEPIPLDVKVVVVGTPGLYHLLYSADEDFRDLFKVKVDFAPDMEWSDENVTRYAAFLSRCVRTAGLRHFDRSAVARIVEHGARLRDHQGKLSTRLLEISDLAAEASFWAGKAGRDLVGAADVDTAIARKEYRSSLPEERMRELIDDGTLAIDVEGERVGQVNAISVADFGDYRYGSPSRVTARVALGRGAIESIEREIELSGRIHSKGFLILSGYLAGQYGQESPLALKATIAFEQAYNEIDGDSASSTELYALLSALSDLPLRQDVAVTGSVDQFGNVQAVGGVTDKIEGFFAACKARGLSGEQGVMVPASNVRNLMLADEVVDAVRRGEFHVWSVRTIDEGIELLTGHESAEVHGLVRNRLNGYAERLRAFASVDGSEHSRLAP